MTRLLSICILMSVMQTILKPKPQSLLHQVLHDFPALFASLKPGDVVSGTVLHKGSKLMLVDLGKNGTGAVYGGELVHAREMVRGLQAGSIVFGKVISPDNEEGFVELSIADAGKQKAWEEVNELREKDEAFTIRPSGFNKGGLIADIAGLKAFLPLSQLSPEHYPKVQDGDKAKIVQELQRLLKEDFSVKIIDVNSKSDKLIISERAATEDSMKRFAEQYSVGQIIEGVISGVASFGAFIRFTDNPAVEGLIHISELDYRLIENPKEVVSIDEQVTAKIIEIKDGKIYLSLKALKADPWEKTSELFKEGAEVRGRVYAFHPFGAIIDLGGVQGQIHVTEFGGVQEMKDALLRDKEYGFIIQTVKLEERRIYLKLKK